MKHAFNLGTAAQVTVEFDGPYDASLWSIRREHYNTAFIGNGIDMRSAAESAVRVLRTSDTNDSTLYQAVERELQDWLLTHPMTDIRQGDSHCRLYCILKIVRL